jgi:putative transposase
MHGSDMTRQRHSDSEIEHIVGQYKAGTSATEISRTYGIHKTTLYNWVSKADPTHATRQDRMTALNAENERLKLMLAETVLAMILERADIRADKAGQTD